jgi:hypothetical protein
MPLPVFTLNTLLYPLSANTWGGLAEAYEAKVDTARAKTIRLKKSDSNKAILPA